MEAVIDMGSELLMDRSAIRDPYLRLLTAALGQRLAPGSPWVALDKRIASLCCVPSAVAVPVRVAAGRGPRSRRASRRRR